MSLHFGPIGKLKITYDNTNNNQCLAAVVKNRSATIPLKTGSSLPYDCSISVVSEEPAARIDFDDLVASPIFSFLLLLRHS